MSLSAAEIAQVVGALQPLVGAFVQKINLPEPRSLYLEVREPGASHLLLICAEVGRTRLHLARTRPPSPEPPFAFQGLLRAELMGTAIAAIEAPEGERLVRIRFRGREGAASLVAELTGRHGNLFLLDAEDRVRGSAVPNLSEVRDNGSGKPYVPLRTRADREPEAPSRFAGLEGMEALSEAIGAIYEERDRAELSVERRRSLLTPLRARQQRIGRTLEKVREDLARAMRADEHLRRGELLKANLGRLTRGMREVTLTEYTAEGVQEVVVKLDPAKGPRENLEREFHQYRRLHAGQTRAQARLDELEGELAQVRARIAEIEAMDTDALLAQAGSAPGARAVPGAKRREAQARSRPFREYLSPSGQRIRVGRGAKENDALTFRYSKGNDVWLHVRGLTGAHVVIPLERDEQPKEETLRDAALLAVQYSEVRGGGLAEVAWTRVKYVHKTKGVAGAVTYSQEKGIAVRPDAERLARLVLV